MKNLMILLAVLMIASVSFGENGPSPLITPSSVSGLGTIATVDSPVPIANGGTGATSAATGLAALGGASLNGSSAVDFAVKALTIHNTTAQLKSGPFTATTKSMSLLGNANATAGSSGTLIAVGSGRVAGHLYVIDYAGGVALTGAFLFVGQTLTKLAGDASLTATKDNASTLNIYYESGVLVWQNNRASTRYPAALFTGVTVVAP
ncbi:hypothetical protein EOM60_05695 [Candidatus Saccharibacteria bacterium]|nr:hypothetical protein [Candidatus Saccharibacteria bacterium]